MSNTFAPGRVTHAAGGSPIVLHRPSESEVEEQWLQLEERRQAAARAAVSRKNAATARAVGQAFSEYARAFRKAAATRGSDVDHRVAEHLADYCAGMADEYRQIQIEYTAAADRAGSF